LWWVTAAPFFLCPLLLIASGLAALPPVTGYGTPWTERLGLLSVPFSAASIALIAFTAGTHRIPIALWHQQDDAPSQIVTYGPYRWVRHPFYAAFLLALFGGFVFCPHPGTLATFLAGLLVLNRTAAREERRLLGAQFGPAYAEYLRRTGRFVPKRVAPRLRG
ncbi:MAG: methyltransferase family protein, partial [Candidatus Eiseniibacteriota bacterium]